MIPLAIMAEHEPARTGRGRWAVKELLMRFAAPAAALAAVFAITASVGQSADQPTLCGRCVSNIEGIGEVRKHA